MLAQRGADIRDGERFEDRPGIAHFADERFDLSVVRASAINGLLEDRRIRGHSPEAGSDELAQLARRKHRALDVVQPDALAGLVSCCSWFAIRIPRSSDADVGDEMGDAVSGRTNAMVRTSPV